MCYHTKTQTCNNSYRTSYYLTHSLVFYSLFDEGCISKTDLFPWPLDPFTCILDNFLFSTVLYDIKNVLLFGDDREDKSQEYVYVYNNDICTYENYYIKSFLRALLLPIQENLHYLIEIHTNEEALQRVGFWRRYCTYP